jgi:hypothetical protein
MGNADFIYMLNTLQVRLKDILVSNDTVSLFTKVPITDALSVFSQHSDEYNMRLFCHNLASSFFCFSGQFYEQTDRVTMGLPLSPMTANFFMKDKKRCTQQGNTQASLLVPTC